MAREAEVLKLQTQEGSPKPQGVQRATDLLLAPDRVADRIRHFVEEVYDTSPESHISRFMKVLLGDAGAGQVRKRLTVARLQQSLQGTHFFDLDRFYGALFDLRRHSFERYILNPYSETAQIGQWREVSAKDGSYRSRVEQFGRAISYGPTPTGIELAAEAVLAVDCEVLESYTQADAGFRTYAELEADYPTYDDMEGETYATLEGEALPRLESQRREFIVRPKRAITLEEAFNLSRVLDRLKPADSRYTIEDDGIPVHMRVPLLGAWADSTYWEVVSYVSARPITAVDPYAISAGEPTEQPRPAFCGYQGEAWSYNGVVAGATAYSLDPFDNPTYIPTQRIVFTDGSFLDYEASSGLMAQRYVQSGRSVSDAILVAHPYSAPRTAAAPSFQDALGRTTAALSTNRPVMASLYADRVPIDALTAALNQTQFSLFKENVAQRFWVSPARGMLDNTREVLEVRLATDRLVNYLAFEVAHYPHTISVQVYDSGTGRWVTVLLDSISDSLPQAVNPARLDPSFGHPFHGFPGHWERYSRRIDPILASRFRIVLQRIPGVAPRMAVFDRDGSRAPLDYSLGVRGFDVGYRVTGRDDIPDPDQPIGVTTDILGSLVEFRLYEEKATNLLNDDETVWRSEPQPVGYAVVNFYLDTQDEAGEGLTIDRFYLDPTHTGAHITIYHSNKEGEPEDESFFDDAVWTPLPRDYVLHKGYAHIPPTKARWFKFEFTNLTAEVIESFMPITRRVRLFPSRIIEAYRARQRGMDTKAMPEGLAATIPTRSQPRFRDSRAITVPVESLMENRSLPTEAIYATDPIAAQRLREHAFTLGMAPWHQETDAPRFGAVERHAYEEVEVRHAAKVGYFVGLKEIRAYRVDYGADDDTEVYVDHFWDALNIQDGMTWEFDPNVLYCLIAGSEATSRVFMSRHNVRALQFATQQTDAVQIIPDADFVDPFLSDYTWDGADNWRKTGDAFLAWQRHEHSVLVKRLVVPGQRAVSAAPGPHRGLVAPVFSYRERVVADEEAASATYGGMESPLVGPSRESRIYAAARVVLDTDLTNPLVLQILAGNNEQVLAEKEITGRAGEMLEWYIHHDVGIIYIPPPAPTQYRFRSLMSPPVQELIGDAPDTVVDESEAPTLPDDISVKVRLIQRGKSNDQWRVDNLSLFDEGIVWEFSVNGGSDWYAARGIRNNQNGVLVFPEAGNFLMWRARGMRAGMAIDYLKIRPWYTGVRNARQTGIMRGPNVSTYDHDPPIHEDPDFTSWTIPVPRWWWYANKRYPLLPVEGLPSVTQFARFYARSAQEDIRPTGHTVGGGEATLLPGLLGTTPGAVVPAGEMDFAKQSTIFKRGIEEPFGNATPTADAASRGGSVFFRTGLDSAGTVSDSGLQATVPPTHAIVREPMEPPTPGMAHLSTATWSSYAGLTWEFLGAYTWEDL